MSEQAPPQAAERIPDHLIYFQGIPVNPVKEAILTSALEDMDEDFRSTELARERGNEFLSIFEDLGKEKSPEEVTDILLDDFLSYRDVLGDSAVSADTASEHPEAARAYAQELARIITSGQSRELINIMRFIQYDFEQITAHIPREVTLSPYSKSISWILWDIGKQEALKDEQYWGNFTNKWHYSGSPFLDHKMSKVITYRHLGWEMHQKALSGEDMGWLDDILSGYPDAMDLLHKVGDDAHHGQLRSSEYVDLGIYLSNALHAYFDEDGKKLPNRYKGRE